jgi:hypothetical protein
MIPLFCGAGTRNSPQVEAYRLPFSAHRHRSGGSHSKPYILARRESIGSRLRHLVSSVFTNHKLVRPVSGHSETYHHTFRSQKPWLELHEGIASKIDASSGGRGGAYVAQ